MRRQHLAVFMLFVRSSFKKVLGVLALMVLVESVWFCHAKNQLEQKLLEGENTVLTPEVIEEVFESEKLGWLGWLWRCAWLVVLILFLRGWSTGTGAKVEYTLDRLSISRQSVCIWQSLYNSGCFLLFRAVDLVVTFGLVMYCAKTAYAVEVTNQSLFLAFWVVSLKDIFFWVELGLAAAGETYSTRRGKHSLLCFLALYLVKSLCFPVLNLVKLYLQFYFKLEFGLGWNLIAELLAFGLSLVILWRYIWKEGEKNG